MEMKKIYSFLEELDKLSEKYGLVIDGDGYPPFLYDTKNKKYTVSFGISAVNGKYTSFKKHNE